jgi:hypothetical protein
LGKSKANAGTTQVKIINKKLDIIRKNIIMYIVDFPIYKYKYQFVDSLNKLYGNKYSLSVFKSKTRKQLKAWYIKDRIKLQIKSRKEFVNNFKNSEVNLVGKIRGSHSTTMTTTNATTIETLEILELKKQKAVLEEQLEVLEEEVAQKNCYINALRAKLDKNKVIINKVIEELQESDDF